MAVGDVNYCLADLAGLLGSGAYTSLSASEQATVLALFNEAYRECYILPDGRRPRWSQQYISFLVKAPMTLTVSLTAGAKTLGSPSETLEAAYAGSMMKIGAKYYTYAGKNVAANADFMVEPWDGATGTESVTFYYSSYVLPVEAIDLCEEPELLGCRRLSPMTGREQEIRNRAYTTGDFEAEKFGRWPPYGPIGADFQAGEPVFYFIDSASLNADSVFVSRHRFNVYPLPDGSLARTVRLRANIVPAELVAGPSVPVLPGNAVTDILLPIARMKVVMTVRRFNGNNRQFIIEAGQNAMTKLVTLASPQRGGRAKIRMKPGY